MTTYRTIASTETDADSPVTVQLMTALADNPTAIAEGASGAPRVDGRALDLGITAGSGASTGSSSGGIAVIATDTALDNIDAVLLVGNAGIAASATGLVRYRTSTNNGSTWSGYSNILKVQAGASAPIESFGFYVNTSGSINAIELSVLNQFSGGGVTGAGAILRIGGS